MPAQKTKRPASRKTPKSTKKAVVVSSSRPSVFSLRSLVIVLVTFSLIGVVTLLLTRAATVQGPIVSALGTQHCLDNSFNRKVNSNKIQLYNCNGSAAQKWTVTDANTIVNSNGYCLDVKGASKAARTVVQLYACNGTVAQKWSVKSNGSIVNPNSGLCLDVKYGSVANNTQIWTYTCNGTDAQKWVVPATVKPPQPPTTPTPTPTPTPVPTPTPIPTPTNPGTGTSVNLFNASKKEIAMQLVSSAENSSLNWKAQYVYIEDIGDGRGYTGGIIGFCSGCSDMLSMVQYYNTLAPNNVLAKYIPALKKVDGTASHTGLGDAYVKDWKTAAKDVKFQQAQDYERDKYYFNPAVNQGIADGIHSLGQFIYYDAMVVHGPGNDAVSFGGIRAAAMKKAKTPAQGGNETTYLNAFMDARVVAMKSEAAHEDVTRIENAQRVFLKAGNLNLDPPLKWSVYGDPYSITKNP